MSERSSPLTQRVRRLLSTGNLAGSDEADQIVAPLQARLDAIEQRLVHLAEQARTENPPADNGELHSQLSTFHSQLSALEKQISRAGREQLKANSLAEAQIEHLSAALEVLRAADARRETEMQALRAQSEAALAAARLEVARNMLPALDGIDEALRSGQQLLEQQPAAAGSSTLFERMRARMASTNRSDPALRETLGAWLTGLTFVRQRLLDALAAEGVQPIPALNRPFDPRLHVALEVVSPGLDCSPGTVVSELRRGYMHRGKVLRHAEVAVAGDK